MGNNEAMNNLEKEIEVRQQILAFLKEKGLGSFAIAVDNIEAGVINPAEIYARIIVRLPTPAVQAR